MFFFVRHAPHKQRHRPHQCSHRRVRNRLRLKRKQLRVHPVRPAAQVTKTPLLQHSQNAVCGNHHAGRCLVKMAEQRIAPGKRNLQRRIQDFRKFRVEGGCKPKPVFKAVAPRRPAQRAFSRNMDHVGLKRVQYFSQAARRTNRQINAGVTRTRTRLEQPRMNHLDHMPCRLKFTNQFHQCCHDAVNLRLPGVGNQRKFHGVMP